ncbi:putative fungal zinc cluster transcription factor [Pseudozyma hubeiensis]|nr:putative fungal zinc cluster transcription factor [Pseudozyma hubeiensis]
MPELTDTSPGNEAVAASDGQTGPSEAGSSVLNQDGSLHSNSRDHVDPTYQHDSAHTRDDAPDSLARASKARASDSLRRSQACLACRKRKLRCDAKKPTCTRCEKAWFAYHSASNEASSSSSVAPPCEYDTSILARIFKRSSPEDTAHASTSQPTPFVGRRDAEVTRDSQLTDNEQLRAQISRLQEQLQRSETIVSPQSARESSIGGVQYRRSATSLYQPTVTSFPERAGDRRSEDPSHKRFKYLRDDGDALETRQPSRSSSVHNSAQASITNRDTASGSPWQQTDENAADRQAARRVPAPSPSVLSWRASITGPGSATTSKPTPPHHDRDFSMRSPHASAFGFTTPQVPSKQVLDRLIQVCRYESWLFSAINSYALTDVAALLDTVPSDQETRLVAQALMLSCVATGLPLLSSTTTTGISFSSTCQVIDALLRSQSHSDLPNLDSPAWIPAVTQIYANGARGLLHQVTTRPAGSLSPASFMVRLLLVEISLSQSTTSSSQADLALAVADARLLQLYSSASKVHPRLSSGVSQPSNLARALRGLMQSREETLAFWSLFVHDCYQSRLALLPTTLERQSVHKAFPRQKCSDVINPSQRSADQGEASLGRQRRAPTLHASDTSMSLLVKVSLVLDECYSYNVAERQWNHSSESAQDSSLGGSRQGRDDAFRAAHESIRHSRAMLSHYDERLLSHSDAFVSDGAGGGSRSRDRLLMTLMMQDKIRFTAEVTHHLAVLGLFETGIDIMQTSARGDVEVRSRILNAAVWLSRLAGMASQEARFLFSFPSVCSVAFFVAARWLLNLQFGSSDQLEADISTLTTVLRERGQQYSRDAMYAKAVVALKRELDLYGRICISPLTWPIEAVSEFVQLATQDRGRAGERTRRTVQTGPLSVSVATLAASIEDTAVLEISSGSR